MHSVTSNAVARLGNSVTLLLETTWEGSVNPQNLANSIENYKFIVVEINNDETPICKGVRTYPSKVIQDCLLNAYLHDTARFNETYYIDVRYSFPTKTTFAINWVAGSWTLSSVKVWGVN